MKVCPWFQTAIPGFLSPLLILPSGCQRYRSHAACARRHGRDVALHFGRYDLEVGRCHGVTTARWVHDCESRRDQTVQYREVDVHDIVAVANYRAIPSGFWLNFGAGITLAPTTTIMLLNWT